MKKYLCLVVLVLFFWSEPQTQELRNASGELIGRFSGSEYRDSSGKLIYRVGNDGTVRDASGALKLRVSGDEFRTASGQLLGRLKNEEVRNSSGRLLGRIQDNGDVRNASGQLLGRSRSQNKKQVAVVYFFMQEVI